MITSIYIVYHKKTKKPIYKNKKVDKKTQALCSLQVFFLIFNCQTPVYYKLKGIDMVESLKSVE